MKNRIRFLVLLFTIQITAWSQYIELTDIQDRKILVCVISKGTAAIDAERIDGARFTINLAQLSQKSQEELLKVKPPEYSIRISATGRRPDTRFPNNKYRFIIFDKNQPVIGFYSDEVDFLKAGFEKSKEAILKRMNGELSNAANVVIFDEAKQRGRGGHPPDLRWRINFLSKDVELHIPSIYLPKVPENVSPRCEVSKGCPHELGGGSCGWKQTTPSTPIARTTCIPMPD